MHNDGKDQIQPNCGLQTVLVCVESIFFRNVTFAISKENLYLYHEIFPIGTLINVESKIIGDSDKLKYIISPDRKHCFVIKKKRINHFKIVYFCWGDFVQIS